MKKWQLSAIVSDEPDVMKLLNYNADEDTQSIMNEADVLKILIKSSKTYFVTSHNYLRASPIPVELVSNGISIVETMSVVDAYKKYGADAITEVIDYGSYNLSR